MPTQRIIAICHLNFEGVCLKEVERDNYVANAVCFACKEERNRRRYWRLKAERLAKSPR